VASPEIEDNRIAFAIDEAALLPKLEQACAIRSRTKERSRRGNCFVFIGSKDFCPPNDLAIPVEQVTAIFERPYWRRQPKYLVQERKLPGLQRDDFKPDKARLRILSLTPRIFLPLCCGQATRLAMIAFVEGSSAIAGWCPRIF
jgi:hypothetical protein